MITRLEGRTFPTKVNSRDGMLFFKGKKRKRKNIDKRRKENHRTEKNFFAFILF